MMIGTLMPALCPAEPSLADRETEPAALACDPAAFVALMSGCLAAPPAPAVTPEARPAADAPRVAAVQVALRAGVPAAPPALHPAEEHQIAQAPQIADLATTTQQLPAPATLPSPVPLSDPPVTADRALPQQAHQAEPLPMLSSANTPVMPRTEAGPAGRVEPSTPRPATAPTRSVQLPSQEPVTAAQIERTQPVAAPTRAAAGVAPRSGYREIAAPEPVSLRAAPTAPVLLQAAQPAAARVAPVTPGVPLPQPRTGEFSAVQPEQALHSPQLVQAPPADPEPAGEPRRPVRLVAAPPAGQVADAVQQSQRQTEPAPLATAAESDDLTQPVVAEPLALQQEHLNADEAALPPRDAEPTDPPRERHADEPALKRAETLPRGVPGPEISPAPQHTETGRPPLTHDAGHAAVTIRGPLRLQASEHRMDAPERLVVELDPPELGRCELELSLHEGRVRAALVAERPETVAALRSVEGQVREQLAARELQVAEFDVRQGAGQEQRQGAPGHDRQESFPRQTAHARMRLQSEAPLPGPPARRPSGTGLVDVVA